MRLFTNICCSDLNHSMQFYIRLLGMQVKFESDWYVQLCAAENSDLELGLIKRDNELVPEAYRRTANGFYISFVVEDVELCYKKALEMQLDIVQAPRNEFYGQRRFLLRDPDHCLLDINSPY